MLHPLNRGDWDRTVWCGPGVLSILTGSPVAEMAALCGRMQQKAADKVSGTWGEEITLALYELGYHVREIDLIARYPTPPTLRRFLRERPPMEFITPVLINIHKHWGACHMGFYSDNQTHGIVAQAKVPGWKRPVVAAFTVTQYRGP